MSQADLEIVVDDPTAPEDDSPSVVSSGTIEIVVCLLLLALLAVQRIVSPIGGSA